MAEVKQLQEPEKKPDLSELGATGQTSYLGAGLSEYNQTLRGVLGLRIYDQMRRSDAQVRATLHLIKAPILAAQWYCDPASDDPQDQEIAEFVWWALNSMRQSWTKTLSETLLFLDYGYYLFEKVFVLDTWTPTRDPLIAGKARPRSRPVVRWDAFAPRHPLTIYQWRFDGVGDFMGVFHNKWTDYDPNRRDVSQASVQYVGGRYEQVWIPASKMLVFTLDEEAGDPTGISVLRSAYKHWFYKENLYKVDAIQKERHGIGVPVVHLPANFTDEDKKLANEMGANLRTNEKAHVVLPPGWELEFAAIPTQPADALKSAEHHDTMISRNVLAQFLNAMTAGGSSTGRSGAGAIPAQMDIFIKSLRYIADLVRLQIMQDAIPELVRFNYPGVTNFPVLKARRIGEATDWRTLSVAIRNLMEPGLITPDPQLEAWTRDQMDLPAPSRDAVDRTVEDRLQSSKQVPSAGNPAQGENPIKPGVGKTADRSSGEGQQ